jgi:hypothetical protein
MGHTDGRTPPQDPTRLPRLPREHPLQRMLDTAITISTGEPDALHGHVRFGGGRRKRTLRHWHLVGCLPYRPYRSGRGRRKRTRTTGTSSAAYFTLRGVRRSTAPHLPDRRVRLPPATRQSPATAQLSRTREWTRRDVPVGPLKTRNQDRSTSASRSARDSGSPSMRDVGLHRTNQTPPPHFPRSAVSPRRCHFPDGPPATCGGQAG